jgi:hypothetical protein
LRVDVGIAAPSVHARSGHRARHERQHFFWYQRVAHRGARRPGKFCKPLSRQRYCVIRAFGEAFGRARVRITLIAIRNRGDASAALLR